MSKNQVKCLRCYKNNAVEGYIYCTSCMEHFPQCKGQKKMIFMTKKEKKVKSQILLKEIGRHEKEIIKFKDELQLLNN
jgi:hypothetical protein